MKSKISEVNEEKYGVYLWEMPNGQYVGDEDQNFLSISSMFGDMKRVAALRRAVASYGIIAGQAKFLPGRRKVTDEEYEEQVDRMKSGLIADPYDFGAIKDQVKASE